jgi:hypothetical protein
MIDVNKQKLYNIYHFFSTGAVVVAVARPSLERAKGSTVFVPVQILNSRSIQNIDIDNRPSLSLNRKRKGWSTPTRTHPRSRYTKFIQ